MRGAGRFPSPGVSRLPSPLAPASLRGASTTAAAASAGPGGGDLALATTTAHNETSLGAVHHTAGPLDLLPAGFFTLTATAASNAAAAAAAMRDQPNQATAAAGAPGDLGCRGTTDALPQLPLSPLGGLAAAFASSPSSVLSAPGAMQAAALTYPGAPASSPEPWLIVPRAAPAASGTAGAPTTNAAASAMATGTVSHETEEGEAKQQGLARMASPFTRLRSDPYLRRVHEVNVALAGRHDTAMRRLQARPCPLSPHSHSVRA